MTDKEPIVNKEYVYLNMKRYQYSILKMDQMIAYNVKGVATSDELHRITTKRGLIVWF